MDPMVECIVIVQLPTYSLIVNFTLVSTKFFGSILTNLVVSCFSKF